MNRHNQSQFLFPDHVYIVNQKNDDGDRDIHAFSDYDAALAYGQKAWKDLVEYATEDKDKDEIESMYAEAELNEDDNWKRKKIPCHAWCSEICWDEVWVEELIIEH